VGGEIRLHSSQSGYAWIGKPTRGLEVEQLFAMQKVPRAGLKLNFRRPCASESESVYNRLPDRPPFAKGGRKGGATASRVPDRKGWASPRHQKWCHFCGKVRRQCKLWSPVPRDCRHCQMALTVSLVFRGHSYCPVLSSFTCVSVSMKFTSHVLPPSFEKACSKWDEVGVMSEMTFRTKIGLPFI
jgi:hypothetical protein